MASTGYGSFVNVNVVNVTSSAAYQPGPWPDAEHQSPPRPVEPPGPVFSLDEINQAEEEIAASSIVLSNK